MKIKQYKKHSDIPQKYTWDLESILEGKTIEAKIQELLTLYKGLIKIKDSKYDSSKSYLKALKQEDEFIILNNKVSNYLSNRTSQNVVDPEILKLNEQVSFEMYQLETAMGSEDNRFYEHRAKIASWLELSEFKDYKHTLESHLESLNHKLKSEIEEFRIEESRADISAYETFAILTNSEIDFGFALTSKGQKIAVTQANRGKLAKHPDPKVRKTAALSYRNAFLKHKGTLANLLFQHFKNISTWAKLKKFDSAVEMLIYSDRANLKFLETLYQSIQDNLGMFKKVDLYHKKFYQKKFKIPMTKYDYAVDLVKVKSEYSILDAQKLTLESLQPFGSQYTNVVEKALYQERWIDYLPAQNKRSGAYSIGASYGLDKKFILMNFDGTLRSVETLTHEMGHSMHSYFSDENNGLRNSSYTIFIAEIASIFNELMLLEHLLENSQSDEMKFSLHQSFIEGFEATVLRQIEWSNYEYDVYNAIDKGTPLSTYDALAKVYYENHKKYSLQKIKPFKLEDQWYSVYVPHFYYNFYVYKYAIGQICGNIFYRKYKLEGAVALQKYIDKFLSAGGRDWPMAILKDAGIDLLDPTTYQMGFDSVKNSVDEWIRLGKKIFKV